MLRLAPESFDKSRDAKGVRWLLLSSSLKCEEGFDDFLLERAITIIITASMPKTMPAIATPLITDLSFFFLDWLMGGVPGGGGGACPFDHEFPPVLWN